jgi:uncharacterized membrane protein
VKQRAVWIDVLRLLAIFQMVQGHSIDAVLADPLRTGSLFEAWTWMRGLTSIAFLFVAGFAFHLVTLPRLESHLAEPAAVRRRFVRALQLVAIGYALHGPLAILWGDFDGALRELAIVDVLHCIGLSLLVLEALAVGLRDRRRVVLVAAVLATALIALVPVAAGLAAPGLREAFVLNYVTSAGGSIFPLVPWAGYLFAGVVAAEIACPAGSATSPQRAGGALLGLALVPLVLGVTASGGWLGVVGPALVKLGVVIAVTGALAFATAKVARLSAPLETLAGESLVIYAFHILVLYGAGFGFASVVGPRLSLVGALGVAVLMLVASAAVGLGWARWKGRGLGRAPLPALRTAAPQ